MIYRLFILLLLSLCLSQTGAAGSGGQSEIVRLPELTVSARRIIPEPEPWRYALADGVEVLSNAYDSRAQTILQNFGQFINVLHSVAPSVRIKNVLPLKIILCGRFGSFEHFIPAGETTNQIVVTFHDNEQSYIVVDVAARGIVDVSSDTIAGGENGPVYMGDGLTASEAASGASGAETLITSLRLDLSQQMARAYLRLRFSQMKPLPPAWFEEGMIQLFSKMKYSGTQVEFAKIDPAYNPLDTMGIRDPQDFNYELSIGSIMPLGKLFSVSRESSAYKSAGVNKWAYQCHAFIHYCLYSQRAAKLRPAFTRFVDEASRNPVDEAMFKRCFGMSFNDMEIGLRNYSEFTDYKYHQFNFKNVTRSGPVEFRDATDPEVGRIKGEAIRLSGRPELGRAELLGPYTRKRTDAQLLAALGLDELQQGSSTKAKVLLERSVNEKVERPRAYVTLGNLYMQEWLREPKNTLTAEQFKKIQILVFAARTRYPPMLGNYMLYVRAIEASGKPASTEQLSLLVEGCELFQGNVELVYKTAELMINAGDANGAEPLVRHGLQISINSQTKIQFEALLAKIQKSGN